MFRIVFAPFKPGTVKIKFYCRQLPDQIWVQCDHPECLKWRKLPEGTDPDKLPDKWYCKDNPNPRMRSCSIPEEKEEEVEQPYVKTQKKRLWVHCEYYHCPVSYQCHCGTHGVEWILHSSHTQFFTHSTDVRITSLVAAKAAWGDWRSHLYVWSLRKQTFFPYSILYPFNWHENSILLVSLSLDVLLCLLKTLCSSLRNSPECSMISEWNFLGIKFQSSFSFTDIVANLNSYACLLIHYLQY